MVYDTVGLAGHCVGKSLSLSVHVYPEWVKFALACDGNLGMLPPPHSLTAKGARGGDKH